MTVEPEKYMRFIAPPPVVLVSTLYGEVQNVSPYGMVMPVSSNPPLLVLGVAEPRDTLANIRDIEEFVVGIPGPEYVEQVNQTAKGFPRDVSEFEKSGLTPDPSSVVKPFRIRECQVNLECKLEWMKKAGDHWAVTGRVVFVHVDDRLDAKANRGDLEPIYHVEGYVYARKGQIIR